MLPTFRNIPMRPPRPRFAVSTMVLAFGACCSVHADTWVRQQELVTVPTTHGMHLGASVGYDYVLDSTYTLTRLYVGAPLETVSGLAEAGVVYVFNPSDQGWVYFATLTAPTPQARAHFGATLASSQGALLVGAPEYTDTGHPQSGAIEFFTDQGAGGVVHRQTLVDTTSGNHLGRSIAVSGRMAAISYDGGNDVGCVATMRYTAGAPLPWDYFPNAQVCGAANGDALGASLAILQLSSTSFLAVAGAPGETHNSNAAAGGAHVYAPNPAGTALVEVGTLTAQNPALLDSFGTSVGIDANYVYVGGTGRDNGTGRTGSVSIFKPASLIGYDFVDELFPNSQASVGGLCGAALAVDPVNSQIIVGCPSSDGTVANEGFARIYQAVTIIGSTSWFESLLSFGNLTHGADDMGRSVALFGNTAFAGAPLRDATSTDHGAVEIFAPDLIFRDGFQ